MRKILPAVFMTLILAAVPAAAQSLAGTWVEPQHNAVMTLAADGTYALQYPGGSSRGKYGLNVRLMWMQDASTGMTVWYTVTSLTEDALTLRDSAGLYLNYRRKPAETPAPKLVPDSSRPAVHSAPARTLDRKDGLTLTSAHVETGVGLVQVIIGRTIKPAEVKEIEARSIVEFNQNPAYFVREIDGLSRSLAVIRGQTDPVKVGLVRQQLFAALHLATAAMREADKPLLIQICNRYVKVLAVDPANKLVLTDRDADGLINYLAFQSGLAGQAVDMGPQLKASFTADLVRSFPSMSLEQKQLVCSASLIWELLESNWSRLTPAQKEQYRASYLNKVQAAPAPSSAPGGAPSPKSPGEAMRDYQARQNMMRMMNRMNMNSHALSLNIIENIGGTGNYWKVVDY
jgi:hypothetical protein